MTVVANRRWHRKIDAHHTYRDLGNETLGRISTAREDRNRVALVMEVRVAQRLLERLRTNDLQHTGVNGQVVMKYDASKWDVVNNEGKSNSLFKLFRKSNHNISIFVWSTLEIRLSLEDLVEVEKKQMGDLGFVYKNSMAVDGPALEGLHFIMDEGKASQEELCETVGKGKFGSFALMMFTPKLPEWERGTDPEVNKAFFTWAKAKLDVP